MGGDSNQREQAKRRRSRVAAFVNTFFFLFAAFASVWLVVLAAMDTHSDRWIILIYVVILWAILAYVFLPRLYRLMTAVFVPDYFIGRARTSDGLLGDVVNMAWMGPDANIHRAMQAAGWVLSEPVTFKTSLGIIGSVLTRRPYPQAPVSPLFLFGRQQDFAYQEEVGDSANQRHHVRFWKTPENWPLPGGQTVGWLAAAAYDTGVRLSGFTLQVTHAISGDIDEERDYTIASIKKVDPDVKVTWIEKFSTAFHARNGGGDMVHTDGNLPIVDVTALPESIPLLDAGEVLAIKEADPTPPRNYFQKLRQTPRPLTLYLTLVLLGIAVANMIVGAVSGHTPSLTLSWITIGLVLASTVLLVGGITWGRWFLMVFYGLTVLQHVATWIDAHMTLTSHYEIISTALATALLVLLSSEGLTAYAESVTEWLRARRHQRPHFGQRLRH